MATTARIITARKPRRCGAAGCNTIIQPYEDYVRHVAFPGDSDIGNTGFWVLRICVPCHTQYGQAVPARRAIRVSSTSGG